MHSFTRIAIAPKHCAKTWNDSARPPRKLLCARNSAFAEHGG
jgi:hypothetical protein